MSAETAGLWVGFIGLAFVVLGALLTFLMKQSATEATTKVSLGHLGDQLESLKADSRKKDSDVIRELHSRDERLNSHDERLRTVEQAVATYSIHGERNTVKFKPGDSA